MKIDIHGHLTAPESLYAYKAGLISPRGAHGRGSVGVADESLTAALHAPIKSFGGLSAPFTNDLPRVGSMCA